MDIESNTMKPDKTSLLMIAFTNDEMNDEIIDHNTPAILNFLQPESRWRLGDPNPPACVIVFFKMYTAIDEFMQSIYQRCDRSWSADFAKKYLYPYQNTKEIMKDGVAREERERQYNNYLQRKERMEQYGK